MANDRNSNICEICGKPGLLLCCDTCPYAYHFACVRVDEALAEAMPAWICPECESFEPSRGRSKRPGSSQRSSSPPSTPSRASSSGTSPFGTSSKRAAPASPSPASRSSFVSAAIVELASASPAPVAAASPSPMPASASPPARATNTTPRARGNVRGPSSALTSFLAEHGISARGARFDRPSPPVNAPANGASPSPSSASPLPASSPAQGGTPRVVYREVTDDEDDEDQDRAAPKGTKGKKRAADTTGDKKKKETKKSKKQQEATKKKAKRAAKKKAKTDGGSDDSDSDFSSDSSSDEELRRPRRRIAVCGKCGTPFTNNLLRCLTCSAASASPNGRSTPRRRRGPEGSILSEIVGTAPRPLQDICIQLISRHIEKFDSLGEVASDALVSICDLACRLRHMNGSTVKLFVTDDMEILRVIDCAALDAAALSVFQRPGPSLTYLELGNCGRMNGALLRATALALPNLVDLSLTGLFLPSDADLAAAVESLPQLQRLKIADSPYAGRALTSALADAGPRIVALRLQACGGLLDAHVGQLAALSEIIELSFFRCHALTDEGMALLFSVPLACLQILNLSECDLLKGVGWSLGKTAVKYLKMAGLPLIEDAEFQQVVAGIANVEELDVGGCVKLTDTAVAPLVTSNAKTLTSLSLRALRLVTLTTLDEVFKCSKLEHVDFSWLRAVDGDSLEKLATAAPKLKTVRVWGDNKVHQESVRLCEKQGITVSGFEGSY